jgi:hypothetical protein
LHPLGPDTGRRCCGSSPLVLQLRGWRQWKVGEGIGKRASVHLLTPRVRQHSRCLRASNRSKQSCLGNVVTEYTQATSHAHSEQRTQKSEAPTGLSFGTPQHVSSIAGHIWCLSANAETNCDLDPTGRPRGQYSFRSGPKPTLLSRSFYDEYFFFCRLPKH